MDSKPTATFWCTFYGHWPWTGNPDSEFDTGLHDYAEAQQLVEVILRLEGKL